MTALLADLRRLPGLLLLGGLLGVGCAGRQARATDPDMEAMQVIVPDAQRLWSDYDDRRGSRIHGALDIKADRGDEVLASETAVVKGTGEHRTAGKWVDLEHPDGRVTRYLHLSRILVRRSEEVRAGQLIGRVGDTGNAKASGPHLHFELVEAGQKRDPLPYLRALSRIKARKR